MASSSAGEPELQPSPGHSRSTSVKSNTSGFSTPPSEPVADKPQDESSKLRTFLGILRKFIGVSDIAAVRFSLPAQLLEPTPNLEYWGYLDRPETFVNIGDSDDEASRMLNVLRFWFTKDLKYVKGKPCKPYNSTLGEFFRCTWDVQASTPSVTGEKEPAPTKEGNPEEGKVRLSYLTEQTSHHPPVSAFFIDCPQKGISARGYDQLSAKFTGTSIRVIAGAHNLGIYVNLKNRGDEEYHLTHPAANLGGIIRGSLSVTVSDTCYITCKKTGLKVILHYLEEGWLGKTQNRVNGVIFKYSPEKDDKTKIRDVPEKDVVGRIEGCWQDKVYYTLAEQKEPTLLIDLRPLDPIPKSPPPEKDQLPNESLRFWNGVTQAIVSKKYSEATRLKQEIEEKQRQKAAQRKRDNAEWRPRFFTGTVTPIGKPELTDEGRKALDGLYRGDYHLEESERTAA